MKLLSFAVWGTDPKYLLGAVKNALLAQDIYPDWTCRFYVSQEVPFPWVYNLRKIRNVEVVQIPVLGDWTFSFNRFLPMSEEGVDAMISRDTDSRISIREKAAVDEWLAGDKDFHIMKDHPWHHTYPILAGMFGCKANAIKNISAEIAAFDKTNWYHSDQEFLKHIVYPKIKNNTLLHDDWNGKKFPISRNGYDFIGQSYNEKDETIQEHVDILKKELTKNELHIHHHLGLGDHIDCNAMVRMFLETERYSRVCVFAKNSYAKLIEYMYHDEPRIVVLEVDKNNEYGEIQDYIKRYNISNFLRVGHENYPWGQEEALGMGCAEIFYKQVGINYQERFDRFYFKRDEHEETRVFNKLNPGNEEYVFVHDDPDRGFSISDDKIYELNGGPIKIIKNDMEENLFHFIKILENAKQIHCMESCFRSLVETSDINGELFFHNFREGASAYLGNSTRQQWREIKW